MPTTYTEGTTEVLPVTFPDGTKAELTYPTSLALAGLGVAPNITESNRHRCGSDPIITALDPRGMIVNGRPLASFDGLADSIELWEGAKGYLEHYLVFTYGSWSVAMPCSGSNEDSLRDEGVLWADHLDGFETPDGFLVLEASEPLGFYEAGSGSGPALYIGTGDMEVDLFLAIETAIRCTGTGVERDSGWARFCLADNEGAVTVTVESENQALVDAVVNGLQVRDIVPAS